MALVFSGGRIEHWKALGACVNIGQTVSRSSARHMALFFYPMWAIERGVWRASHTRTVAAWRY